MTKSKKTSKTRQKFDFGMEQKSKIEVPRDVRNSKGIK